jgi:hypothetical protein
VVDGVVAVSTDNNNNNNVDKKENLTGPVTMKDFTSFMKKTLNAISSVKVSIILFSFIVKLH